MVSGDLSTFGMMNSVRLTNEPLTWCPSITALEARSINTLILFENDPTCKSFYAQGKDFMDKYYLTDKELEAAMATAEMNYEKFFNWWKVLKYGDRFNLFSSPSSPGRIDKMLMFFHSYRR